MSEIFYFNRRNNILKIILCIVKEIDCVYKDTK